MLQMKFKRTDPRAKAPTKAYAGDAGWDIYATESVLVPAGGEMLVPTGIAFEIPEGWHIQVHTRSSYGKKQLRLHLGIIDAGYRNEISVWVCNHSAQDYQVLAGDKVAQLLLLPVPEVQLEEAQELSDSERGTRGHGSSGR